LFFVDDEDGQIHAGRVAGPTRPLTQGDRCYADLVPSPDGRWLVAVEETPQSQGEPENRLVAIALTTSTCSVGFRSEGPPRVVAKGHDFYASACFSAAGDRLAFLRWDHPNMPWTGTTLELLVWAEAGAGGEARVVAGGESESLFQPRFDVNGGLFVASDRSGWWNLVRIGESETEPVQNEPCELGHPQWVFGLSRWAFLADGQVLGAMTSGGRDRLVRIDVRSGQTREWSTSFSSIGGIEVNEGWAACLAGSPTRTLGLYVWHVETGQPRCVRESAESLFAGTDFGLGTASGLATQPRTAPAISSATAIEVESVDGRSTHAFIYTPESASNCPAAGERYPLLVKSHGGPTAATSSVLDPRIQFWTSRGFTVADVNYGGSTGYGRDYRDSLKHAWGIVDVEDCVAVARSLAKDGLVDGNRMAISGGSAGGYTTLCALTFHDVFSAGASHYGIGDLEALARDTHKFESHYTDWLVGPLPEYRDRYIERSPIHHHQRLDCPVIFFQGLEDRVVPPSQAEAMVAVLAKRGIPHAYVPFAGEQHGFRRAENIRTALDGELYFYSKVFGFAASQPAGVVVVSRGDPT
jgi:dipeptidyl aminopeptidase/acylaminoacyl peptidase